MKFDITYTGNCIYHGRTDYYISNRHCVKCKKEQNDKRYTGGPTGRPRGAKDKAPRRRGGRI